MSSACASVLIDGTVVVNTIPINQCTGYVIVDSADYGGSTIWQVPEIADLSAIWALAFSLPMSIFLISWSIGSVVRMFKMR